MPGRPHLLASVTDSAYSPTRILTVDTARRPATVTGAPTVTRDGAPVGYDAEGLVARRGGGHWLAVEGSATTPNLLVRLDARGRVRQEVPLPADVAAAVTAHGLEGIAETGGAVWVAVQRPVKGDPPHVAGIGRWDPATGGWSWLAYPLDAASAGWTGLSELVAVDRDTFAVIERDNQRGPQASVRLRRVGALDRAAGGGQAAGAGPAAAAAGGRRLGAGQGGGSRGGR